VNKSSQLVPLIHNIAQLKVNMTLRLQQERGLPIRVICLKARQFGISTYFAALNFESVNRLSNHHACVVSADIDATNKVFGMYETFQAEMPDDVKRATRRSNRKEIVYEVPHRSSILCQTAGKQVLGRGGTTQKVHASEVAFWANAKKQLLGLSQEVPETPESLIALESTACGVGGEFHDRYWQAVEHLRDNPDDYSGYLPIFLPWFIFPEYATQVPIKFQSGGSLRLLNSEPYLEQETVAFLKSKGINLTDEQVYWRRGKIKNACGGDLSLFKQEYPATAKEAFQSTGKMIFLPTMLDKHEQNCCQPIAFIEFIQVGGSVKPEPVLKNQDCWKIWKWPESNHEYIAFGDVCEGILANPNDPKSDPDSHAGGILDRDTFELVATFHGRCDTIPYGEQMVKASVFYNYAWASPEVNSCGLAVLNEFKRANYPKIYSRQGKDEELIEEDTSKLGYKTTVLNRKPGIETLKQVLKEQDIIIYDKAVIDELRVFVNKNGRPEAESGYHDDFVMMLVGLIQLHLHCPLGDSDIEQETTSDRRNQEKNTGLKLAMAGAYDDLDEEDDLEGNEDYEDYEDRE
jgi:hypothetical protein